MTGLGEVASFYKKEGGHINAEANRLRTAATEIANRVSMEALRSISAQSRILDVGAGADASLGNDLVGSYGCSYTAVEPNGDFIQLLREGGVEALQGFAADLPVQSNCYSHVHSRFVHGWLNREQQAAALAESVRAIEPGLPGEVLIIDYDWSAVEGPDEFLKAIEVARRVLEDASFNPDYGAQINDNVKSLAQNGVFDDADHYDIHDPVRVRVDRKLGEGGLDILRETADSLVESLGVVSDSESREAILAIDTAMEALGQVDSEAVIRLPDVVAQSITIVKNQPSLEVSIGNSPTVEGEVTLDDLMASSVPGVGVVKAGSPMDYFVRKIQATEYLKNGLIDKSAIDSNGLLREDNYSEKLVDRSACFVAMSESSPLTPVAAVRIIAPDTQGTKQERLHSLPTASQLGIRLDSDIFPQDIQCDQVMEVSALIRNSQESSSARESLVAMTRVILGASIGAKEAGYRLGIMTVQESAFKLVSKILGKDNFREIVKGSHPIGIKGTIEDVEYVSLYIEMDSFLDGVEKFADESHSSVAPEVRRVIEEYRSSQ